MDARWTALPVLLLALAGCADLLEDLDTMVPTEPWDGTVDPAETQDVPDPDGDMFVYYVDVRQGDSVILEFPDSLVVIDSGRWTENSYGRTLDRLDDLGITRIDHFLITHPDADHAGGCQHILRQYDVGALYHPGIDRDTATWRNCMAEAEARHIPQSTDAELDPGDYLDWSDHARVRLLHIDGTASDPNDGSLVVRVDYGATRFLFMGDAPCQVEQKILDWGLAVRSDVLMAGHHGSRTSTCQSWLDAVDPAIVVISHGNATEGNSYGHPHAEVLDRLDQSGAIVLTTDASKTLLLASDGIDVTFTEDV